MIWTSEKEAALNSLYKERQEFYESVKKPFYELVLGKPPSATVGYDHYRYIQKRVLDEVLLKADETVDFILPWANFLKETKK